MLFCARSLVADVECWLDTDNLYPLILFTRTVNIATTNISMPIKYGIWNISETQVSDLYISHQNNLNILPTEYSLQN